MPPPDIDRPSPELIERISSLATSTLANALDNAGLHNNVIVHIKASDWQPETIAQNGPTLVDVSANADGYGDQLVRLRG